MSVNYLIHFVTPFGVSLFITLLLIPLWITACRKWNLFEEPDSRKHHKSNTPSMGGIAIFAGMVISFLVFAEIQDHEKLRYLLGAMIILFFTGFFDDLMNVPPFNKLVMQVMSGIIIFIGGFKITSLEGVFWVHEITPALQLPLTIFLVVMFTNAFNFID